jgi:putative ABC transport system substrate-binding protein
MNWCPQPPSSHCSSTRPQRREFITLVGGAAASWPLAARGQEPARIRRIGVLSPLAENDPEAQANVSAFRQALEMLSWTDRRNLHIDYRWGSGDSERIRAYAIELVGLKPDVFLVSTALVLQPLQQETRSIPIVFTQISDPVGSGFVASLSHPGGNVTGFAIAEFSIYGKSLEVLKEAAPHVTRVAVILNPEQKPQAGMWRAIEAVAPSFRVQLTAASVRNAAEIERAIDEFAHEPNGGLIVLPNPVNEGNRKLIITMAARHRLPAVYAFRFFVTDGGLISYGVDLADQYRQAASYVDRILRGEKPAELPVQQPTKFALVVNLKTAKALGLDVPPTLLSRADEVIE